MAGTRAAEKSASAFRTISEVSDDLQVPQHVLRFWETKFSEVRPMKRGGNRRYYRPEDIELLRRIRDLLYSDGYTIKGVQKLLREGQIETASPVNENGPRRQAKADKPAGEPTKRTARDCATAQADAPDDRLAESERARLREVLDMLLEMREQLGGGIR